MKEKHPWPSWRRTMGYTPYFYWGYIEHRSYIKLLHNNFAPLFSEKTRWILTCFWFSRWVTIRASTHSLVSKKVRRCANSLGWWVSMPAMLHATKQAMFEKICWRHTDLLTHADLSSLVAVKCVKYYKLDHVFILVWLLLHVYELFSKYPVFKVTHIVVIISAFMSAIKTIIQLDWHVSRTQIRSPFNYQWFKNSTIRRCRADAILSILY